MTLVAKYFDHLTDTTQTLDISGRIRVPGFSVTANAEEGSVALCTVVIDDPLGELNFLGMRRVYFEETSESPGNQRIWSGFLADATISRGPGAGPDSDIHVIDTARRWTLNMADVNSLISRKLLVSSASSIRPVETDVARVQQMISAKEMGPIGNSAGYFSTASPVTMDSTNYVTQTAWDLINSCAQHSGKNWFAFYDEPNDSFALFYDFATSTAYSSDIRLTNVLADFDDSTTFLVTNEATMTVDPSRLADQILLGYNGGYVRVSSTTTRNTYFGADYDRWLMMPNAFTTSASVATTLANRYLAEASTPDTRITCSFLVPKEKVNGLREGQRVLAKFSHFPGYSTDYSWMRCLKRTVTQVSPERYMIEVVLSPGGSSEVSISCSSQTLTGATSGQLASTASPKTIAGIPADATAPGISIAFGMVFNNGTDVGSSFAITGDYTQLQTYSSASYDHTMMGVGYDALANGSFTMSWSGAVAEGEVLSTSFSTSATSPVQSAQQNIAGGTVTLSSTPTAGNLMVLCRVGETGEILNDPGSSAPLLSGWSKVIDGGLHGAGFPYMDIWVRCIGSGESKTVHTGNPSFSHWAFLSEWTIS